ncbi:Catalase HPII [Brucella intermedia]|nr:Catalase HPII [Brucella intermedia]
MALDSKVREHRHQFAAGHIRCRDECCAHSNARARCQSGNQSIACIDRHAGSWRDLQKAASQEDGQKVRLRAESFADHYSQARQFYLSQTETEQKHIAMALTFELSKVETPVIRERIVSNLLNIDANLAEAVAGKLGIRKMPKAADAMVPVRDDLAPSPALSIIENGPGSFNGRKIGVLVANGTDAQVLKGIRHAAEKEGAMVELVAPTVGGFEASSGDWIEADHMIDGGPSVLFDAVALVLSDEAADRLTREAAARDFVADAFAHCKFIGFTAGAMPLLAKAGIEPDMDEGLISLDNEKGASEFVTSCRKLRLWARENAVKL